MVYVCESVSVWHIDLITATLMQGESITLLALTDKILFSLSKYSWDCSQREKRRREDMLYEKGMSWRKEQSTLCKCFSNNVCVLMRV